MCQILMKPKDYTLPYDLLAKTCNVNADGWGIMGFNPETKELAWYKEYNGDNDPSEIYDRLKDVHDQEVWLHFRYKTKGEVNTDSCHPFVIYDDNDKTLCMMHNGTLTGYGSATQVDSEDFGKKIIAPLYDIFLKSGISKPLENPFFKTIVTKFTDSGSKIVLLDSNGSSLIINESQGEMFTDENNGDPRTFWISNKYSFNMYHRTGGSYNQGQFQYGRTTQTSTSVVSKDLVRSNTQSIDYDLDDEEDYWRTNLPALTKADDQDWKKDGENKSKAIEMPKPTKNLSYWGDILQLKKIDALLDMTNDEISDFIDLEPEHAKMFMMDLIYALHIEKWGEQIPDMSDSEFIDSNEDAEEVEITDDNYNDVIPFAGPYVHIN